jgi:hypothetical protein
MTMWRYLLALSFLPALYSAPAHAALPVFDTGSLCPQAEAERAPQQFFFRTCMVRAEALPADSHVNLIVERFLPNGKLDPAWGNSGRVRLDIQNDSSCFTSHAGATAFFPPDGRVLILPGDSSRLLAFRADGTRDEAYGTQGVSSRICDAPVDGLENTLLSLDMLADGRFVSISTSKFFFHGYVPYCVATRLRADGSADPSFTESGSVPGRIGYGSIPCTQNTIAWSLQEDNSLQVAFAGQLGNSASTLLYVYAQDAGNAVPRVVLNRVLPQRGVVFHMPKNQRSRDRDGSIRTIDYSLNGPVTLLPSGRVMVNPGGFGLSTGVLTRYFVSLLPNAELDPLYGDGGVTRINFPAPPPGCVINLTREEVFTQRDGSIVYTGHYWHSLKNAKVSPDCIGVPYGEFAVKLLPGGKLDLQFPQWRDPASSGARFTTDSPEWTAVEYYNPRLDRYFFTPHPQEADYVDRDATLTAQGWWRTGKTFGVWNPDFVLPGTASACRFAADPIVPPKSFYDSIQDQECNILREQELATPPGQRAWRYDRESFRATPPVNGVCPSTLVPIYSLYNQGHERGIDSNFRYVNNLGDFNVMIDRGWVGLAQPQFCARPD